MLEGLTTWLLLPLGMALGWALSRKSDGIGGHHDAEAGTAAAPLVGMPDNPELQLTLGSLFRRRGEVERALQLHQALLQRHDIGVDLREETQLELAEDFQQAGLMDQAEAVWRGLAAGNGRNAAAAVQELLTVAEQGREWNDAIRLAKQLESLQGASARARVSHYHCELGEAALTAGDLDAARRHARQAERDDPKAVRPRWLQARVAEAADDLAEAVDRYRAALEIDGRYIDDLLPELLKALERHGDASLVQEVLGDIAVNNHAPALLVAQADQHARAGGDPMPMLAAGLASHPSRVVLKAFLATMAPRPEVIQAGLGDTATALRTALETMEKSTPGYVCEQCGFTPRNRFWQCPACRHWGTIHKVPDRFGV